MDSTNQGYQILNQGDSKRRQDRKNTVPSAILAAIATLITLALLGLAAYFYQSTNFRQDCGQSPAEARKRGCQFDIMAGSWLPSHCFNPPLAEEYIQAWQFPWTLDVEGFYPVSLEIVRRGEHESIWTTAEFHRQHCAYLWRKLVEDITMTKWVDEGESEAGHIAHCAELLTDSNWLERGNRSIVTTTYPSCTFLG